MKQVLIYTIKIWLTSLIILWITILGMIYYRLSQPDHPKEWLDPVFGTIVCLLIAFVFLPAIIVFALLIEPIGKRYENAIAMKAALSLVAGILILVITILLWQVTYTDLTYLQIGGYYFACILIGIWIYRLPAVENRSIKISRV